jgi:tetratricopeptide (TPR) repeat protein
MVKDSVLRILLIAVLLIACAGSSFARNILWHDDLALWTDTLEKSPKKARGLNELGIYYADRHEYENAVKVLQLSLSIDKYQPRIYTNLGVAYEGLQRYDLARNMYQMAIGTEPDDPTGYYNLGVILYRNLKSPDEAFRMFEKARDLNPYEPDVHLFLSYIYHDRGDTLRSDQELKTHLSLK